MFREEEVVQGRRSYNIGKSDGSSYKRSSVTIAISDRSATICHRMSATFNSTGGDPFWVRIVGSSLWSTSLMLGVARCRDRTPQAN